MIRAIVEVYEAYRLAVALERMSFQAHLFFPFHEGKWIFSAMLRPEGACDGHLQLLWVFHAFPLPRDQQVVLHVVGKLPRVPPAVVACRLPQAAPDVALDALAEVHGRAVRFADVQEERAVDPCIFQRADGHRWRMFLETAAIGHFLEVRHAAAIAIDDVDAVLVRGNLAPVRPRSFPVQGQLASQVPRVRRAQALLRAQRAEPDEQGRARVRDLGIVAPDVPAGAHAQICMPDCLI